MYIGRREFYKFFMSNNLLKIYCDGGARGNPGPAAAAFVALRDGETMLYKKAEYLGIKTNNEAEYSAVILALKWLAENPIYAGSDSVRFYLDSELVTKQLSGNFKIKSKNLAKLFLVVKSLEKKLSVSTKYNHIPRVKNKLSDYLVNKTLDENSKRVSHPRDL